VSNGVRVTVEPSQAEVVPGRVVEFVVDVFNSGATVAEFEATLVGMEPSWFTVAPARLSLLPNGEGSFRARLAVPADASVRAGRQVIGIRVASLTNPDVSWVEEVRLNVTPIRQGSLDLQPRLVRGGRKTRFVARLRNQGNVEARYELRGDDPEAIVAFTFRPPAVTVAPFQEAAVQVEAETKPPWTGAEVQRALTIVAAGPDELRGNVTWVQKPRLAAGLIRVLGTVAAIAAVAVVIALAAGGGASSSTTTTVAAAPAPETTAQVTTLAPAVTPAPPSEAPQITVPDLATLTVDAAEAAIAGAGLEFIVDENLVPVGVASGAGAVAEQDPAAGTSVVAGTTVTVRLGEFVLSDAVLLDCIPYDPANLELEDLGEVGWRINSGSSALKLYDTRDDAELGMLIVERHTQLCFIGRSNERDDRFAYLHDFWVGDSGRNVPEPSGEDCDGYDPEALFVEPVGALGWRLGGGTSMLFDTQEDAAVGLELAQAFTEHCYIGRGNTRPDPSRYVAEYWR
jgi:hypothetical protein